jgi:hypothetical protein
MIAETATSFAPLLATVSFSGVAFLTNRYVPAIGRECWPMVHSWCNSNVTRDEY